MSRKPLLIIFITVFVDLLGFGIVLPLLPRYAEHFLPAVERVQDSTVSDAGAATEPAATDTAVAHGEFSFTAHRNRRAGLILGCLMASFSAMQFLFAPLWGMLSDRIGRRPVLLVGLAGSTIFYALFALVTQWGNSGPILGLSPLVWLFVTRIGAGISGATIPTAQAYIADCTDESSRGKGMAIIGAAFGIGFTFGPLLGSLFVPNQLNAAPSPAPGYVAAVLSGLAFIFGFTSLPESRKLGVTGHASTHGWLKIGAMPRVLSHRVLGPIILAVFLTTFAFAQFETTLAMLTKRLGVDDRGNFYVFAYIGLVLTLAQGILVRRLIPRLGEYRMALVGVVLMTVGLLLISQTAYRAQTLRQIGDQVASFDIKDAVAVFRSEQANSSRTDQEFLSELAASKGWTLPTLPAGTEYRIDANKPQLIVAERGSNSWSPLWTLVFVLPVVVIGFSATTPALQAMLSLSSGNDEQGEVLGVGQSISSLARIAGPVVGMTLQDRNLAFPYWAAAGLMAIGILMVARLKQVIPARTIPASPSQSTH
ncbi:MFS transporter [Schlesneria paludicola]|uniref:MFS transporter n=1 Tax=Schlesneria paludicola TaxID=360056 RepID=UPI00029AD1CB|nr:MFS transporter [Schlesneria paludicola]